jgi:hypothetical protein
MILIWALAGSFAIVSAYCFQLWLTRKIPNRAKDDATTKIAVGAALLLGLYWAGRHVSGATAVDESPLTLILAVSMVTRALLGFLFLVVQKEMSAAEMRRDQLLVAVVAGLAALLLSCAALLRDQMSLILFAGAGLAISILIFFFIGNSNVVNRLRR